MTSSVYTNIDAGQYRNDASTQEDRILELLRRNSPGWTPAPELAKISLQYCARLYSIRHRGGIPVENKVEHVAGTKHGFYRLAVCRSAQKLDRSGSNDHHLAPSAEFCRGSQTISNANAQVGTISLFPDLHEQHKDLG